MPFVSDKIKPTPGFIPDTQQRPGFFSRVKKDIVGRGEELGGELARAKSQVLGGEERLAKTDIGAGARLGLRTGGAVAGSIFDVFLEGAKSLIGETGTEKVKGAISDVSQASLGKLIVGKSEKVQNLAVGLDKWAKKNPDAVKDLEDIIDIGALIPVGRGAKVSKDVATKLAKESVETGVKTAGKGLAVTGAAGEKVGRKVVSTIFGPTEAQAKKVIAFQAKNKFFERLGFAAKDLKKTPQVVADVVLKYNLAGLARGNIASRAKRIADRLWTNQVEPVFGGITERISKKEVFDGMKRDILKVPDISKRKGLLKAFTAIENDFKHVTSWRIKTLNQIKTDLTKALPAKVWKGQDITGNANKIRLLLSGHARQSIRKRLPKEALEVFDDYGSLATIVANGEKAIQRGFDAGILGVTSEAIRILVTPIATIGGTAISKTGTALKKAGQFLQNPTKSKGGIPTTKLPVTISKNKPPAGFAKRDITPEPLAKEARKYKTADEFVKTEAIKKRLISEGNKVNPDRTITLYHATSLERAKIINKSGILKGGGTATGGMTGLDLKPSVFLGTNKKWVKDTWGSGREVIEVKIPIKDVRQPAQNTLEVYVEGGLKRGNDGIWRPTTEPRSTFYDKLAEREINKSQLTDIFNQVKGVLTN